jgi:Tfp pilus assembly protein PilF
MIRKAVSASPESAAYLDSMGWVMYKLGEFPQAAQLLEKATALPGGKDAVLFDHLGDALWRADRKADAAAKWRESLDLLGQAKEGMQRDDQKLQAALKAKLDAAKQGAEPATAAVPAKSQPPSPPVPPVAPAPPAAEAP